jgi:hypothetical protein
MGVAALLLLLVAAGCQSSASPTALPAAAPQDVVPQPTPTRAPVSTSVEATVPVDDEGQEPGATLPALATAPVVPVEPQAEPLVTAARADLAQRLGVPEAEITVYSVEEVQWPDGSLGCPKPGMAYIQVITPGFRVILQVEGTKYEYHTDTRQSVVLCEEASMVDLPVIPSPVGSEPGVVEPGLEGFVSDAKEDLAQRLSISVDEIELLSVISVVWSDGSLGCPQPGMDYIQVPQDGVLIQLSVGGVVYNYHGGGNRGLFLCEQKLKSIEPLPPPGSPND